MENRKAKATVTLDALVCKVYALIDISDEIDELSSLNVPKLRNRDTKQDAECQAPCFRLYKRLAIRTCGRSRLGLDDALHVLALAQDLIDQAKVL